MSVSTQSSETSKGVARADLWGASATELAEGIAAGAFSSREATESCLSRIDDVNGKINAVVEVFAD